MKFFEEDPKAINPKYKINMPLAMTMFIYRNSIIEDYHHEGEPLTKEQSNHLYNDMYNNLLKFNAMRTIAYETFNKCRSNQEVSEDEMFENLYLYISALSGLTCNGSNWDEPEDVSEIEYSKFCEKFKKLDACYIIEFEEYLEGVIAYLWNGELKKAFDNKIVLTDAAMKIINKDIHNKLKYLYDMVINDKDEEIADLLTAYLINSELVAEEVEILL